MVSYKIIKKVFLTILILSIFFCLEYLTFKEELKREKDLNNEHRTNTIKNK